MTQQCGWQLCDNPAQFVRDTPWGDLHVCGLHVETPLYDDRDGIRVDGIKFKNADGDDCTCDPEDRWRCPQQCDKEASATPKLELVK